MLRDKNLVPLSRQHQHALALCVRIGRASPISESDLIAWQQEIAQHFRTEIRIHFEAEELFVFPAARTFAELNPLIEELLREHAWMRTRFAKAEEQQMSAVEITEFARGLSGHIRKEERQLFERLQQLMDGDQLTVMGRELEQTLKDAEQACALRTKKDQRL
jgi:hemerythrin-like domain-containing protein